MATVASAGEARSPAAQQLKKRRDEGTTPSSPPPAGAQIWPGMKPLDRVEGNALGRGGCRIRGGRWRVVSRAIKIDDAGITHHQFPTARIPRWKRLAGGEFHRIVH